MRVSNSPQLPLPIWSSHDAGLFVAKYVAIMFHIVIVLTFLQDPSFVVVTSVFSPQRQQLRELKFNPMHMEHYLST